MTGKEKKPSLKREIIYICKRDWLTKISHDRWQTFQWQRHLKPTEETLESRRRNAQEFNPDLIYPGDTFEVLQGTK